jgi:hypothetical protein
MSFKSSILNNFIVNHVIVIYDSISNNFTFSRKHHPSPNDYPTILNCISCCDFLGIKWLIYEDGSGDEVEDERHIQPRQKNIYMSMFGNENSYSATGG